MFKIKLLYRMFKTLSILLVFSILSIPSNAQKYKFSGMIGINKSFINLSNSDNYDANKINNVTSIQNDYTWSFQKQFESKNALNWLRFLEYSVSVEKELKKNHTLGFKLTGAEMNNTYTEYPLEWGSDKKFEVPANQFTVLYSIISPSIYYSLKIKERIEPSLGLSVNKLIYQKQKNIFYESNQQKKLFFTIDVGIGLWLTNSFKAYAIYNQSFTPIAKDKITLNSPTAYGHKPANFTGTNTGSSFHTGLSYRFNTAKSDGKPVKLRNKKQSKYNSRYTVVDTSVIEVCFYDKSNNDGDIVDFYVNGHLLKSNIVTDSTQSCFTIYINQKETELRIVAVNDGDIPPNTASVLIKSKSHVFENFRYSLDNKHTLKIYLKFEPKD